MFNREEFIKKIDEHKPFIWGLFLSFQILGHALGSISLVIISAILLLTLFFRRKIHFNFLALPILVYFLWGLLSIIWTTNPERTLSGVGLYLSFLVVPLTIFQYSDFTLKDIKKTIDIFSISLILYFVACLVKSSLLFIESGNIDSFFYHDLTLLFKNNAIYISLFVSICTLIKINLPEKKLFDKIIIFALIIFLLLLSSKNLIISTFFLSGLSFILFKNYKKISRKTFILLSSISILFISSFFYFDLPLKQRFLNETTTNINEVWNTDDFSDFTFNGSSLRLFQWRATSEMIENNQIGSLGLGLNNVNYLTEQYFHYYNLYEGYMPVNFHNQFLQTLGELGFIGLALLLFIFYSSIKISFQTKNKFLLLFTLLIALCFLTESYFSRQKGIMFFSVMYCLLLSYSSYIRKTKKT